MCLIHGPFALLSHPRTGEEKQKRITVTAWFLSSFSSVSLLAAILMRTCGWSCLWGWAGERSCVLVASSMWSLSWFAKLLGQVQVVPLEKGNGYMAVHSRT